MAVVCRDCNRDDFKSRRALTNHRLKCPVRRMKIAATNLQIRATRLQRHIQRERQSHSPVKKNKTRIQEEMSPRMSHNGEGEQEMEVDQFGQFDPLDPGAPPVNEDMDVDNAGASAPKAAAGDAPSPVEDVAPDRSDAPVPIEDIDEPNPNPDPEIPVDPPSPRGPRRSSRLAVKVIHDPPPAKCPPIVKDTTVEDDPARLPSPDYPSSPSARESSPGSHDTYTATEADEYGVYAVYQNLAETATIAQNNDDGCDGSAFNTAPRPSNPRSAPSSRFPATIPSSSSFAPFENSSIHSLMGWVYDTATISKAAVQRLADTVILGKSFSPDHFKGFSANAGISADGRLPCGWFW
ncbi:hypothetical protein MKEN_01343800 [Mycena kentingensis (nom. inval.)]|nr:hypothetical protein MKEN_01343800 [Mycena kentingensis (nom. inval.)]